MKEEKKTGGNHSQGFEFSKLALLIQFGLSVVLTLAALIAVLARRDISGLEMVAGGSLVSDGAITSFYLWKAKTENRAKYAERFAMKVAKEYGIDAALQLTELVLKD